MNGPYHTLFVCTLEQLTAISVGGTEDAGLTDMPVTRDGMGRPILRGTTLAGALIATARTFLEVPEEISRQAHLGGIEPNAESTSTSRAAEPPSLWDVWNAHLWIDKSFPADARMSGPPADLRAGAPQRHDTRAAHKGGLFDLETLPAGVAWKFCLDVTHPVDGASGLQAARIAALALQEWQRERCWIGRRVARGLGWLRLKDCDVYTLPRAAEAIDAWPSSKPDSLAAAYRHISALVDHRAKKSSLVQYLEEGSDAGISGRPARAYVRWSLRIEARPYEPDGTTYGLDALSIGGHGTEMLSPEHFDDSQIVCPDGLKRSMLKGTSESAFVLDRSIVTEPIDPKSTKRAPLVPGSATAGAWRAWLSRRLRAGGDRVFDPATGEDYRSPALPHPSGESLAATSAAQVNTNPDPVASLFGIVRNKAGHDSALLISDARVAAETDGVKSWTVALLEKVALDENAQSPMPRLKFNRMAVLSGTFDLTLIQQVAIEPDDTNEERKRKIHEATALTWKMIDAAATRRIGLGGGEFRGYGHVPFTPRGNGFEIGIAGENWQPAKRNQPSFEGTA